MSEVRHSMQESTYTRGYMKEIGCKELADRKQVLTVISKQTQVYVTL